MPRMPGVPGLATVVAFTALLAGCGGGATGGSPDAAQAAALFTAPADQSLAVEMADIKFSRQAISAKPGEVVEVALANKGSIEHDFSITTLPGEKALRVGGKDVAVADGKNAVHAHLRAGATGVLRLKASSSGMYEFFCTVPSHREAGMKGTLNVQ